MGFVKLAQKLMKEQIELCLEKPTNVRLTFRRQRKQRRAHWWFQQMRQIVDQALDRRPAPLARPEQTYLTLPRRAASFEVADTEAN